MAKERSTSEVTYLDRSFPRSEYLKLVCGRSTRVSSEQSISAALDHGRGKRDLERTSDFGFIFTVVSSSSFLSHLRVLARIGV